MEENAIFLDYSLDTLLSEINNFAETKYQMRLSLCKNLKSIEEVLVNNKPEFTMLLDKLVLIG